MPSELVRQFEARRPALQEAARNLENDLKEILLDANIPASVSLRVMPVDEFAAAVHRGTSQYIDPLVEVPGQLFGRVDVAGSLQVKQVGSQLRDSLSVLSQSWRDSEDHSLPYLELLCLIPPHVLPNGWSEKGPMPTPFLLSVSATLDDEPVAEAHSETVSIPIGTRQARALIMKGGGIKGLAYVGALGVLETKYDFNRFVGTSAGAIAAVLLGAGYSSEELKEILQQKNFKDFFDAKWYQLPFNLIFHKGFHHAGAFTDWLDGLLASKLKSHRRVKLSDLPYRVTIYASQRGASAVKFDSIDNDVHAAYAARCSMSIPWVFVPQSNQGLRTFDGGIQHNYPVDQLLGEYPDTSFISLYLGAEIYEPVQSKWLISDLVSIATEGSDSEAIERFRDLTVIIDPRPIGTLDFFLTADEKAFLLAAGRAGALAHLAPGSDELSEALGQREGLKKRVDESRKRQQRKMRWRRILLLVLTMLLAAVLLR